MCMNELNAGVRILLTMLQNSKYMRERSQTS